MKKNCIVYLLVTMALVLSFTACQSDAPVGSDPNSTVGNDSPVSSNPNSTADNDPIVAEVIEKSSLTDEEKAWLVQNLNAFAFQSAPAILMASEEDNTLYSPAGLYVALSMLGECADGDTKTEILDLLQSLEPGVQSDMGAALMGNMIFQNNNGRQTVDNSVWLADGCEIDDAVCELLVRAYGIESLALDPQDPSDMQSWADERTIGDLPGREEPLNDETVMVIINLISFKDNWLVPFDEARTTQDVFTLADGEITAADYMNAYAESAFIQTDTFAAADYVFSNGSAIHFILPEEGVSPEALLADGSALSTAIDYSSDNTHMVSPGMVSYKIPKIIFSSSMDLSETIQELGMPSAFGGGFPSITPPPEYDYVRVSAIYQDCFFEMDEQGAVAEAKTEIHMDGAESAEEEPEEEPPLLELHLTRPFLFVITAPEGYVTFVGVVNTPTA